jgi:translation initiation factor 3 subunit M
LQNDEKFSKLYELVVLFAEEKLDSFDSFNEKYPDYLESLGLLREDCLKKIRLLSLATLASENSEIAYAQIAKTLNISEDEVEGWVIFAVAANLIDAKLDQIKKAVVFQ